MKAIKIRIRLTMMLFLMVILFHDGTGPLANTLDDETDALNHQLSKIVDHDPILQGAVAGISIRSASSGKLLYQHGGDVRLRPASNMKLFTAAAALTALGENYTFSTELYTDGQLVGNMMFGNLYLRGKGDPTLLKEDFDNLAEQLSQRGVSVIYGSLIGDDTWYDDIRHSVDLPWSDEHTYYGAQISGLTASPNQEYDAGTVMIEVQPAKRIGQAPVVTLTPKTDYLKIVNTAKTDTEKSTRDLDIIREHGTNTVRIIGTIPSKSPIIRDWISVWNPTGYALNLFKQSIEAKGIVLNGEVKEGAVPKAASLLLTHSSMELSDLLVPYMKLSNNVHAETLIKEMGKVHKGEGSWEKGLEVVETELNQLGVNTTTLVIRDGSGISHLNLVPANEISNLLYSIQKKPWFPAFLQSLPIGGEKGKMVGGTLRHRMKDASLQGKIKAKTGTLTSVSSLSGYVEAKSGKTLIFSILLNNLLDEDKGKELEDRIVSILVNQ